MVVFESLDARSGSQAGRAESHYSGRALCSHRELCGHYGGGRSRAPGLFVDRWVLQSLAYGAAAVLCLVRTPPSSCDRVAWRFVAAGVLSFGLANVDRHMLLARTLDPFPIATLCHLLTGIYYACIFIALVHLMQSRVGRLPVSLVLGGAATMAALLVAPVLGVGFAQTAAIALVYPLADLLLLVLVCLRCHFSDGGRRRRRGCWPEAYWC
jgi:hypothetical protein